LKKIYVLDTNVLLQDPFALFAFEDNDVVIPAAVLEEIDGKKRNLDELGRNARKISRLLDELRKKGKLNEGVKTEQEGIIRVELNHRAFTKLQDVFGVSSNDNRILAVAYNLHLEELGKVDGKPVILVSKDALLRIKADAIGITAEDFISDHVTSIQEMYYGYKTLYVSSSIINEIYKEHEILLDKLPVNQEYYPHQFLILRDLFGSSQSAIVKVNLNKTHIRLINEQTVWGIYPKNVQQKMALSVLLDDEIPLVTLAGKAGTGKTLLSLAVSLQKVVEEKKYNKILIARPIVPLGNDIGYLPGEKKEKLKPWVQPIYDNLEYLFNTKKSKELENILTGIGEIEIEAITYIRGRSIPGQFIIIDEAQNLSKHEVKTIISRVGEGSKIILIGDPEQIDHPYLDATNNGLIYVAERFKHQKLSAHLFLEKGERSQLAQLAVDLL